MTMSKELRKKKETEQEVEGREKTNKRNAKGGERLLTSEAH